MKNTYLLQLSLFLFILFIFSHSIYSQDRNCNYVKPKEANQWVFGNRARVNFSQTPLNTTPTNIEYNTPYGVSSISDNNGDLLFFTNGSTVWNKDLAIMANGSNLGGYSWSSQTSINIPHPGNSKQYYIFTIGDGVSYSMVDFTNNNNGSVAIKNISLFTDNSQKICAVKHENNRDYWVVFHGFDSSKGGKFYAYLVDTSGIVLSPVVSEVGVLHSGINNERGYMKASSNGKKIALVLPADGRVELLNFDKSNGQISNPITSNTSAFNYPLGLEFSPDNSKLYMTTSPNGSDFSFLYQFDITQGSPFTNPIVIDSFYFSINNTSPADSLMQTLQLGVDGKIYVSKTSRGNTVGKPNLGVIYNPNRPGNACNYNELDYNPNNGLFLDGGASLSGLPDFASDFLNIPHFYFYNQCHNDTTDFEIRNTANVEPDWDFNDPSGSDISSDLMKPKHVFSEPGNYTVNLTETYDDIDYLFEQNIIINPLPDIVIGMGSDTIYILPNTSIRLDAGDGYDIYAWIPNESSNQYFDVVNEGEYSISVTDTNCCTNTDVVYVKYAKLSFPTAFKPSSSINENQTFAVIGNVGAISKYQLNIFNRWGQLIFESDNPTKGWDGNYNGSPAPMGTYVYSSVFTSFESGVQSSIDITSKGTVTLIR